MTAKSDDLGFHFYLLERQFLSEDRRQPVGKDDLPKQPQQRPQRDAIRNPRLA